MKQSIKNSYTTRTQGLLIKCMDISNPFSSSDVYGTTNKPLVPMLTLEELEVFGLPSLVDFFSESYQFKLK